MLYNDPAENAIAGAFEDSTAKLQPDMEVRTKMACGTGYGKYPTQK